jgi:type IV pilus biogenesis protein PilP
MHNKGILCFAVLAQATAMAADDPAIDKSSLFQRRARAIAELHVLELESQARAAGEDAGTEAKIRSFSNGTKKNATVRLIEICGSGDRLFATFLLPNGDQIDTMPGDRVPGIGVIRAVHPGAVEDQFHHFHPLENAWEGQP